MNDKSLEELFSNYNPRLTDDTIFLSALERKLEAVEYIRKCQAAQHQQNKTAMIIVFIAGLLLGAGAMAGIFFLPSDFTLYTFGYESASLMWMSQHFRLVAILPLAALVAYLAISIVSLWQVWREGMVSLLLQYPLSPADV